MAGHFASVYALRLCLNSVFVRGICVYVVALKAQGQAGVNAQGKISALLVAIKQELPPIGSQVLCRGAAFPAASCPQRQEGNRKSHPFTSRTGTTGFMSYSPRYYRWT